MKYVILSDGNSNSFKTPRQLIEINGEPLVKRTIRLLKENGIEDIIVTSHNKRFDNLGAIRYEPKFNDWDYDKKTGYWISAFPIELLEEPVTFLFGDVYYSEDAIKKIVETKTEDILFFCTYKNKDKRYIKKHDEPLAFKVADFIKFKEHIQKIKDFKDSGEAPREPITWELYRSINGQPLTEHKMTKNYIAINDESCDIDSVYDIIALKRKIGGIDMIKCETIEPFKLERFNELTNIVRKGVDTPGQLNVGDVFECEKDLADYLLGDNAVGKTVVKVIEVIPAKVETPKPTIKKTTTKKKTSKK